MRCGLFLWGILLGLMSTSSVAFNPELDWKTLETQHFLIHFEHSEIELAKNTANLSESIHHRLSKSLNWSPKHKTHLVLTDHTDLANGYASPLPFNRSVLFVHPPAAGAMDFQSWLESLITHEYTHVLHLDKATGAAGWFHNLFGRAAPFFPNLFQPSWAIEGLATYYETEPAKRLGRGQSTLFAMMMREELAHGFKSIDEVNMASPSWPLNARYLYGYFFFEFIAETFGDEAVLAYIENYSDNLIPFLLNTNANTVLGKNMTELWQDFEVYLRSKFPLEHHQHAERLSADGFFKSDIASDAGGHVYFVAYDGYRNPYLGVFNPDNSTEVLHDLNALAMIDLHEDEGILIAQPEVCDEYYQYYDLYRFLPDAKSLTRLTECARYTEAVWAPDGDSIFALKAENGIFQIDKLTQAGDFIKTVWTAPDKRVVSYLDIRQDGKVLLASVQRPGQMRSRIELLELDSLVWQALLPDEAHQWHGQFVAGTNKISFSSDHNDNFSLLLYDTDMHSLGNLSSHLSSGLFQHVHLADRLVALEYSHRGYDLVSVQPTPKLIPLPAGQNAPDIITDAPITEFSIRDYSAAQSLMPTYWLPFAVGNDNTFELGATTSGQDALENHFYSLAGSVELERNLPNVFINYRYDLHFDFSFGHYHDISDDGNDATADIVEQNSDFSITFNLPKSFYRSQWNSQLFLTSEVERQYLWYQDDKIFIRDLSENLVGFSISYNSSKHFLRSISANDGRNVKLAMASGDTFDSDFTGQKAVIDWRELFQFNQDNAFALRLVAASSTREAKPFRAGGNFSAPFFIRPIEFIDDRYALRGYPDFSELLSGRHLRLASAEWRFPVWHVERTLMSPPLGIEEFSAKIFYESARVYGQRQSTQGAYPGINIADRRYNSHGMEFITQFRLFYHLPLKVRMGYAKAEDSLIGGEEAYVSFGTAF